jgi:hypothetical protein
MSLRTASLDELTIDDESSFSEVPLYQRLKEVVRRSEHQFCLPSNGSAPSWDRALFLNLTFWSGAESADVLCDEHIPADVVAHVAWHEVVSRRLSPATGGVPADAMLFGEAIASAFDLYLVGRLLATAPGANFLASQVPVMGEAAEQAGLSDVEFAALLAEVCAEPERAFEDARALLLDVALALLPCRGVLEAERALTRFDGHRFQPLLHHFQLSNWILYARAYGDPAPSAAVRAADAALRQAPVALDWLADHWLDAPAP